VSGVDLGGLWGKQKDEEVDLQIENGLGSEVGS
jgi:hypothetical protein